MYFQDRLIEAQQFQLLNIFIQYIKNYVYVIIYCKVALGLIDGTVEHNSCSAGGRYYIIIVENGSICFVVFNLIALIYVLRQKEFAKLEFFIMYGLNLGWFVIMLLYSLITVLGRDYESFLFICIKKEIEIGTLIFKQSDVFLRQVNICANTVFAFMIFTSPDQEKCSGDASTVILSITIENLISLVFFTTINIWMTCFSIRNQGFKAIRFVSIVILFSFILSYVVIMYFNATGGIKFSAYCVPIIYTMKSYTYIVPISLASMVILYYSLVQQYDSEVQEEEKSKKNTNPQNRFSSTQGIALSATNALNMNENNYITENVQKENRKTISNHKELEQLYKSGQLKNKDEPIDDMEDFQANNSTNYLFKQSNFVPKNSNVKQKQQEQGINFYDFANKMNEKQSQLEDQQKQNPQSNNFYQSQLKDNKQNNINQGKDPQNNNINLSFNQQHNIHSQLPQQRMLTNQVSFGQNQGGATPSFQQQSQRNKNQQF